MTTAERKADTMTHAALFKLSMRLLVKGRCNAAPTVGLGRDAKAVNSKMLPSQNKKKQPNVAAVIKCREIQPIFRRVKPQNGEY